MPRIQYKLKDGTRVPGVTTIAGAFKGDITGLLNWANAGGLEGLTLDDLYGASTTPGTLVHQMIEDHLTGKTTDVSKYTEKQKSLAESSFLNWLHWAEQNELKAILIEPNLISENMRVGGTPDLIAEMHGKITLVDWKSGKPLAYTSTLMQLAAYCAMYEEVHGQKIEATYVVVIPRKDETPSFTVRYMERIPDLALEQFQLLRQAYENEKLLKKMI